MGILLPSIIKPRKENKRLMPEDFEIPECVPGRTEERGRAYELSVAFRETFLVEVSSQDVDIYRRFGEMLWHNEFEREGHQWQTPIKRLGLRAVLRDLEHIEEFIRVTFSGKTNERGDKRISRSAFQSRDNILGIIGLIRRALGMKTYEPLPLEERA